VVGMLIGMGDWGVRPGIPHWLYWMSKFYPLVFHLLLCSACGPYVFSPVACILLSVLIYLTLIIST